MGKREAVTVIVSSTGIAARGGVKVNPTIVSKPRPAVNNRFNWID
jgi:hypothetical protein